MLEIVRALNGQMIEKKIHGSPARNGKKGITTHSRHKTSCQMTLTSWVILTIDNSDGDRKAAEDPRPELQGDMMDDDESQQATS